MERSTKGCLKKTPGSARLTFVELNTVLTEVEGVLNSRPLTYVYQNEIEEPLTPSHPMIGRRLLKIAFRLQSKQNVHSRPVLNSPRESGT